MPQTGYILNDYKMYLLLALYIHERLLYCNCDVHVINTHQDIHAVLLLRGFNNRGPMCCTCMVISLSGLYVCPIFIAANFLNVTSKIFRHF